MHDYEITIDVDIDVLLNGKWQSVHVMNVSYGHVLSGHLVQHKRFTQQHGTDN